MDVNSLVFDSQSMWAGAGAAAVLGLTGSLHCVMMCGPLACAAQVTERAQKGSQGRWKTAWAYQGARVASYAVVGALMGSLGKGVGQALSVSTRAYLPWVMALAFLVAALDLAKFLPALPGAGKLASRLASLSSRLSPVGKAASIGFATAFLPCGLLYGVLASSAATGSLVEGALLSSVFALGGIPALFALQMHTGLWSRLGPKGQWIFRRGLPAVAAVALVVRAVMLSQQAPEVTQHSCH